MVRVIKLALGLCFVLYGSVALAGYGLFGSRTDGDVLKNLTTEAVGEIVGPALGVVLVYAIVGSTAFNLMVRGHEARGARREARGARGGGR